MIKNNNTNMNNLGKFKDVEKKDGKNIKNTFIKSFKKSKSISIGRKLTTNSNQNEKKKNNYLNVISHNICEHRETLRNPCEFYAGFFANIIEKQKNVDKRFKKMSKSFRISNFNKKIIDNNKNDSKMENNFE